MQLKTCHLASMRRFFNTRRFILSGKNKISILNPCSSCSPRFCSTLYKLLFLCMLCMLVMLLSERDASINNVATPPATPSPRIFCIISTYGYRQSTTAIHIKRTWANHCDRFLFVSDDSHEEIEPAVFLKVPDKWHQYRAHLEYVHRYHFDEADWFLYANDDNFVVVENLRHMLQSKNPDELVYFGCKLRSHSNQVYMYDRAAIIFSSATLQRFVLQALPDESICGSGEMGGAATEELSRCLSNINVQAGDSRDHLGHHRILPLQLKEHLNIPLNASLELHKNFLDRSYYHVENNQIPVSVRYISSHIEYMPDAYNLYYMIYQVKQFGLPPANNWQEADEEQFNLDGNVYN
ncbi:glycoprotein-N-acetylgalactosamine 3-beta-galactosyltransferase 1 [Drosophila sulfurigaster albostrigata]|uniref:glycoprotein-N-acetylgalactosamine 3-beta-galactosyltransferase 1 n=1 Tax=Drosophila sulfurigaster albostrigata TaxID=89887 RepID=UPI002D21AECB|nr:glycoprotein-N-acetylgalactosamine 3-beta-galactosyltransferase 1 [Drosophila sulfurigaster albostrigata]XP_062133270.1 glycoprotein-N-acetylgalactosamine 3-beta-galactosyltransferase 1 [Drosophila sulfurigaster albostrigata]